MEWYYELGIRWVPKDASTSTQLGERQANKVGKQTISADKTRRRLNGYHGEKLRSYSFHNFAGPGVFQFNHQKTFILTFATPTRYESIFWYTGRLQFGGKLLRNKIHAHNNMFEQALFFAATPDDLGLTEANGFTKSTPHIPTKTTSVGFANNTAARRFLLQNLLQAQKKFDNLQSAQNQGGNFTDNMRLLMSRNGLISQDVDCGFPNAPCLEQRPKVVCQALGVLEVVSTTNLIYTYNIKLYSALIFMSLSATAGQ